MESDVPNVSKEEMEIISLSLSEDKKQKNTIESKDDTAKYDQQSTTTRKQRRNSFDPRLSRKISQKALRFGTLRDERQLVSAVKWVKIEPKQRQAATLRVSRT